MFEGIFLGICTFIGIIIIIIRLPQPIKRFLVKHHLLSDILGIILTYVLLTSVSNSIIALHAAAIVGLLITGTLYGTKYYLKNKIILGDNK